MNEHFAREILVACHNAEKQGYQELRIDLRRAEITPIRRGPGVRMPSQEANQTHVKITRIVYPESGP